MNSAKPPEPNAEQLIALLDAQLRAQRIQRKPASAIRVWVALLIFAVLALIFSILPAILGQSGPSAPVSVAEEISGEPVVKNF